MPIYGTVPAPSFANFTMFLLNSLRNYPTNVLMMESTMLAESRNKLFKQFLKGNADYCLLLDSDMLLPKDLIQKLLSYNKDVVSAMAFTRTVPPKPSIRKKEKEHYKAIEDYPKDELIEVDAVGPYCMLIKRNVIEKIKEKTGSVFFEFVRKPDGELKGEDMFFCEKIINAGFKIHVATGIKLGHYGGVIFPR